MLIFDPRQDFSLFETDVIALFSGHPMRRIVCLMRSRRPFACGRCVPASSWRWHRWRGRAISRRGGIVPAFPWRRTSCCCGRDGPAVSTNLRLRAGNLVRFKVEKPRRLVRVEPGGNNLPTEKFRLLRGHIHTVVLADKRVGGRPRGRRNTGMIWPAFKSFKVRRGRKSDTST